MTRGNSRAAAVFYVFCVSCASGASTPALTPKPQSLVPATSAQPDPVPSTTPDAPFRAHRPPAGPPAPFEPPPIQDLKLSNGVRVLFIERHDLPIVRIGVAFRGGWADLRPEERYVVAAAGALLEKGTATRSAAEIADAYEALGGNHWVGVDVDTAEAWVKVLTSGLPAAIELLGDVVVNPTFPVAEVELLKGQWNAENEQLKLNVDKLAWSATEMALYGKHHPYGRSYIPRSSELSAITRASLRRAYETTFSRARASIDVAGDTTKEVLLPLLEKAFGKWKAPRNVPAKTPPAPSAPTASRISLVDRPGVTQSLVYLAAPVMAWSSPDRAAFTVTNVIFGRFWMSRLNASVRERLGYSYWVSAQENWRRGPGPFRAGGAMYLEKTGAAIGEMLAQMRLMSESEPTDEELEGAKQFVLHDTRAMLESVGRAGYALDCIANYDRPLYEYSSWIEQIRAITKADVLRVARKYLKPDAMKLIVVAPRTTVEPQLRALGLGAIELRDAYGEVVASP